MTIKIIYEYNSDYQAEAYDENGKYLAVAISSKGYDDAKARLLDKVKKQSEAPEPEVVEL